MKHAALLLVLAALSACGQSKDKTAGGGDGVIAASCADQTDAMIKNHIPLPDGASAAAVTQACIRDRRQYHEQLTKPYNPPVTPATNK